MFINTSVEIIGNTSSLEKDVTIGSSSRWYTFHRHLWYIIAPPSTLAKGNDFMISGFGKWSVKEKRSRLGRNPQTGEKMIIDARRVVTFKSADKLRSVVNRGS
jgi:hypothetical protein